MSVLTPEAIARSLSSLGDNSWLIPNPRREYHEIKYELIDCLRYDYGWERISSDQDKILELKEWRDSMPDWEKIIRNDDVAMFPPCLKPLKQMFMIIYEKDYCETINCMSWNSLQNKNGMGHVYRRNLEAYKADYGVYRFRCVVGDNMLKLLLRHLRMTLDDFVAVYGPGLHDDHCFCDELLVELLVSGHLRGGVRSYKIEREYYDGGL